MKNQYFADKRDFFKWDFLEDLLAGCPGLATFVNVVMLTPPDDSREGNLKGYACGDRREPLFRFLQECLANGKQNVSEMRTYFRGKPFAYYPHGDSLENPYSFDSREEYFGSIPNDMLARALVFFDPDIGLEAGSMSYMRRSGISKYLFLDSLRSVTLRASDDSAIVVYQHLQRDRNRFWDDVEDRSNRFRAAVQATGTAFITDRDIAFLAASRDPQVRLKVSNAVVAHAHKHGYDCGELAA
jgi:hypothetical protein